jgi:FkbM family methyltransferase
MFDVGANVGQTALALAGRFPNANIYSFEPDPLPYSQLIATTRALSRIKALSVALGERDGAAASLFRAENAAGNSLLKFDARAEPYVFGEWIRPRDQIAIEIKRLDSFCREHGIRSINFLKIDTQGAESRVLDGAGDLLLPHVINVILAEVLFVPLYEGQASFIEVYDRLTSPGYRLVDFDNKARRPDVTLTWCDALFA